MFPSGAPVRFRGPALLLAACLPLFPSEALGAARDSTLARASRLASEGKLEEALRLADGAVTARPASVPAQRLYQDLMLRAGEREALVARYRRALAVRKNRKLRPVLNYMLARADPDPAERRKRLEAVFAPGKRHFWAAYDLVELCTAAGDLEAAEKYGKAARDLRPGEAGVRNVLANVYLQAGKPEGAEKELAEALRLQPRFPQARYNLGLVRASAKKYGEAAELFRKAAEENPKFAEAFNNLGHCLARLEKADEAIAAYRKAIALKPDYGSAYNNLAVVLYRRKDHWAAWKNLMLAEKHGHPVAPSFKRVLEKKLFPDRKP